MNKIIVSIIIFLVGLFVLTWDWTKLALIPLMLVCIKRGSCESYAYNPYYLFIVTLLSYALYYYEIAPFLIGEIPVYTNIFIISCLSAVLLGFAIAEKNVHSNKCESAANESFWIIFIIGLLPTALSYIMYGNILDVTEDLEEARARTTIPGLSQLTYFLPASIIIGCKKNNTKLILLSFIFSVIAALMSVSKTGLVVLLIFTLIGLDYYKPTILETRVFGFLQKTLYIWVPLLIVVMFAYNNNKRQNADSTTNMEFIERGGLSHHGAASNLEENLYLNYLYFCSPWGNLSYNIENNNKCGHGANTFYQFGKKIGYEAEKAEKIQPSFLNTHTFITDYYLDFGYFGAFLFSVLLGFFIYFFYVKCCSSGDPMLLSYYAIICFATVMLFFSNHFNNGYLLNYFITMVGYYFISRSVKFENKI